MDIFTSDERATLWPHRTEYMMDVGGVGVPWSIAVEAVEHCQ